ncbi:trihelix transcription factor GT-2 [Punica granatum]|uniref:Trihelix transcription factor GT-2 n=1 Tax=Punica granatum TaxID=22663 RepID=A0A218XME9_PUNGR|nr:trihelix transcription factor GT-2 [Punica granatum]OWM85651.1 hypothetical protein CDL15_Pgr029074 [Punica granatum]
MELFDGDRLLHDEGIIPDRLAPFPELLCHHQVLAPAAAVIHCPDETDININPLCCHNLPPQKLRPIRCTVRSPPDAEGPIAGIGALSGYQSTDVRFFDGPIEFGSGLGEGSGSGKPQPSYEGRVVDDESTQSTSSASDGGGDSSPDIREPENRKRKKRRTERKLQPLIETMVMKVMERQEQMHQQLIEMIEKGERERISREEAWQHQEMERMKREEELRARETSRSLALISLIQKMLGQDIPQPSPLNIFRPEERQGETHPNKDVNCGDSVNKRWPEDEVQALISFRTAVAHRFNASGSKGSVWEEISIGMSNVGYKRSAKKCKEKWENMKKYFKKSMGKGKKRPENSKACPYFQELDILYGRGIVNSGHIPDITNHEGEHKITGAQEVQSSINDSMNNLKDGHADSL